MPQKPSLTTATPAPIESTRTSIECGDAGVSGCLSTRLIVAEAPPVVTSDHAGVSLFTSQRSRQVLTLPFWKCGVRGGITNPPSSEQAGGSRESSNPRF